VPGRLLPQLSLLEQGVFLSASFFWLVQAPPFSHLSLKDEHLRPVDPLNDFVPSTVKPFVDRHMIFPPRYLDPPRNLPIGITFGRVPSCYLFFFSRPRSLLPVFLPNGTVGLKNTSISSSFLVVFVCFVPSGLTFGVEPLVRSSNEKPDGRRHTHHMFPPPTLFLQRPLVPYHFCSAGTFLLSDCRLILANRAPP